VSTPALRAEVDALYADYAAHLDEDDLERWLELFADECAYKIVSRENFDRGLPLALMWCESKGMLRDRIAAIRRSSVFAPRTLRHVISGLRLRDEADGALGVRASFVVLQTLLDEETRVFVAGTYDDRLVRAPATWRFASKICVLDSNLVPGSLVYPV
jgi:anthranilate 1,2-dioxygenase small subunit